jgi:hypothetical protein
MREKIAESIRDYGQRGYRVVAEPGPKDLPDFLMRFSPDIVAYGEDETVVIEVASRESLAKGEKLSDLAAVLEEHEGWRFEVIYVNPRADRREATLGGAPTSLHALRELLDDATALARLGRASGAVILAATAADGLVRRMARRLSKRPRVATSLGLLKTVYSAGPLHEPHYQAIQQLFQLRNRAAHGVREGHTHEIATLLTAVEELHTWEETRSRIKHRLRPNTDSFQMVSEELVRVAHRSDLERFISVDSGDGEVLHKTADEIDVRRITLGEVQDAAGSSIAFDVSAVAHVIVSFLIDRDYVGEVEDPNFEVQDAEAVEGLASATTTRDLTINYTCWFGLTELDLLEADLTSAST